jgi:hypothetical protein
MILLANLSKTPLNFSGFRSVVRFLVITILYEVVCVLLSLVSLESQDISSKKGEFLSLSIEGVKVILDSDALMVAYEEEVFQVLLDWMDANCRTPGEKQAAVEDVAGVIRFPWMTGDFLIDVVSTNPQMQSRACQVTPNFQCTALFLHSLSFLGYRWDMPLFSGWSYSSPILKLVGDSYCL